LRLTFIWNVHEINLHLNLIEIYMNLIYTKGLIETYIYLKCTWN
jgi:hypothetical protein